MSTDELSPVEELESIRKKLVRLIEQAEKTFSNEKDSRELRTSRAALRCVEDAIKSIRDKKAA